MNEGVATLPPTAKARIAGGIYLLIIVGGLFAEGVRSSLVVGSDAVATAQRILAHESLYRMGFAAGIVIVMCNLPLMALFYDLFQRVNRSVALLAAFFMIVSSAVEVVGLLHLYAPLTLLSGADYLRAIPAEQLQAMALVSVKQHGQAYTASLAYFAFFCLAIGYLVYRSTFIPRLVGIVMALAGLCYWINSFAVFLAPAFAGRLFPWILLPCLIGEASLCLWLLFRGVNASRWREHAARMARPERPTG